MEMCQCVAPLYVLSKLNNPMLSAERSNDRQSVYSDYPHWVCFCIQPLRLFDSNKERWVFFHPFGVGWSCALWDAHEQKYEAFICVSLNFWMPSEKHSTSQQLYSTFQKAHYNESHRCGWTVCSAFRIAHFPICHFHTLIVLHFLKATSSHSTHRVYKVLLRVTKTPHRRRWIKIDNAEKQPVLLYNALCEANTKHSKRSDWKCWGEENWYWFGAWNAFYTPSIAQWMPQLLKFSIGFCRREIFSSRLNSSIFSSLEIHTIHKMSWCQ